MVIRSMIKLPTIASSSPFWTIWIKVDFRSGGPPNGAWNFEPIENASKWPLVQGRHSASETQRAHVHSIDSSTKKDRHGEEL
jgi:hypothetical protein